MADFQLSERATSALIDIYVFTEQGFGPYKAEAYHAGLEKTFGLIADFPKIGTKVDELIPGFRRFRFQSHFIFYTIEPGYVFIRAVLHTAQNIQPFLFE